MKIRKQLRLYLIGVVLIPVIAVAGYPLNRFFASETGVSQNALMLATIVITAAFEIVAIAFTIHLSTTISKSITFLQKSTKRLAEGEVDNSLERRKNNRGENEITDLIKNLEKMRLTLREDTERRNKFIMGISHDLRTPVAVIRGYTEAINDGVIEEDELKKTLEIMLTKTNQLENMINTLINYVKLDSQTWKNNLQVQPLEPMISGFINSAIGTGTIFKRNVKGNVEISKELKLAFDKDLVNRALENLYSNALRYTNEGDTITLTAIEGEADVKVRIEDTGIGIDQKDLQYIFDMFYRATNSRREAGFGIGLSVVKNIIDTHGWKIDVESQKGVGTAFIITIPKTGSKA